MGYGQYLRDMLSPLCVYELRPDSFSGGEVEALGAALDDFWEAAQSAQRESIVQTAEGAGLSNWERLLPYRPVGQTAQERRSAIGGFLSISGDSFTCAALSRCLSACGVEAVVSETAQSNTVAVAFPGLMGEPEGFARICEIIESILPCHLQVEYRLRYCTWADSAQLRWRFLGAMTWRQWERYRAAG